MLLSNPETHPAPFDDISFDLCSRRKAVIIMSADLSKYCQVVRALFRSPRRLRSTPRVELSTRW